MRMRTFYVATLGCKVNHYEAEQIAAFLRSQGLRQTHDPGAADLRIVHTCAVTADAASQSRQTIRRMARISVPPNAAADSPSMPRVLVTGCWATAHRADAGQLPLVAAAVGHDEDMAQALAHLLSLWQREDAGSSRACTRSCNAAHCCPPEPPGDNGWMMRAGAPGQPPPYSNQPSPPAVNAEPAGNVSEPAAVFASPRPWTGAASLPPPDIRRPNRQRALLKIQDGCDHGCTYCIVPALRRRLWSKAPDQVIDEARRLVCLGYAEIVLTGVCLGSYGRTPEDAMHAQPGSFHLARLISRIAKEVPGLVRLRLSSLDPADVTPELISAMRGCPALAPHFHLPVQSGSDRVLRAMNRRYGRQTCLAAIRMLSEAFDRPAFTADVMVGFPGETDDDFEQTLSLIDAASFAHVHVFTFSAREGTAAARLRSEFVPPHVLAARLARLRRHTRAASLAYRSRFVGEVVNVVVERRSAQFRREGMLTGRCDRYFPVVFPSSADLAGSVAAVRIDGVDAGRTWGTLVGVVRPAHVDSGGPPGALAAAAGMGRCAAFE